MKRLILLSAIILTVATTFVSCNKGLSPTKRGDRLAALLLGKDTLDMYVGQTRLLPLTINPSNYDKDSLQWKSSDSTILSISDAGLLTAKKVGAANITVTNLTNTISVSCLVTVSPAPTDSLKIGLIAYYPFDNSAADSSGNNYNGAGYNLTSTTDRNGHINSAYYFDGSTSYIIIKDRSAVRLSATDFTINTWVYTDSYNTSYGSVVIDKRGPGSANGWNFGVAGYGDLTNEVGALGVVTYSVSGGDDAFIAGKAVIDTDKWHMITTVYNVSQQQATIYVDGVFDNTANNIPSPTNDNTADIYIGRDNPAASPEPYYFHGKIDDIRVYDRMLKPSEITKLYNLTN
jgi:hypothetical protein